MLVAESFYDGTWASGPVPDEVVDFELMYALHWSPRDLRECSPYQRRFCWDLLLARRAAEAAARERK